MDTLDHHDDHRDEKHFSQYPILFSNERRDIKELVNNVNSMFWSPYWLRSRQRDWVLAKTIFKMALSARHQTSFLLCARNPMRAFFCPCLIRARRAKGFLTTFSTTFFSDFWCAIFNPFQPSARTWQRKCARRHYHNWLLGHGALVE